MLANIYIHANGEIQAKYLVEITKLSELQDLLDTAIKDYQDRPSFCFDVMILRR